jgi:hypothetical protein
MTDEREAEDMEHRADVLKQDIEETRAEWDAKKSDETVPGAQPEDDRDELPEGSEEGPPPEADITPGD